MLVCFSVLAAFCPSYSETFVKCSFFPLSTSIKHLKIKCIGKLEYRQAGLDRFEGFVSNVSRSALPVR